MANDAARERLDVLSRQFTSAHLQQTTGAAASGNLEVCPNKMNAFLVHDNHELRQRIFEFLKVGFVLCMV